MRGPSRLQGRWRALVRAGAFAAAADPTRQEPRRRRTTPVRCPGPEPGLGVPARRVSAVCGRGHAESHGSSAARPRASGPLVRRRNRWRPGLVAQGPRLCTAGTWRPAASRLTRKGMDGLGAQETARSARLTTCQSSKVPGSIPIGASSAAVCASSGARSPGTGLELEGFQGTQNPGITVLGEVLASNFFMPLRHLRR